VADTPLTTTKYAQFGGRKAPKPYAIIGRLRARKPRGVERVLRSKSKRWFKKALVRGSILRAASRFFPPAAVILSYHSITEEPLLTDHILGISRARASFEEHVKVLAQKFSPVTIEDVAQFAKSGRKLPPRAVAVTFDDGFADNYEVALPILNRYSVPATFYIMVDAVQNGTLPWYCRLRYAFNTTRKPEWNDPETSRAHALVSPEQRKAAMVAAWEVGARLTGDVQQRFIGGVEQVLEIEPVKAEHGFMLNWDQVRSLKKAGHTIGAHTLSHPNVAQVSESEARSEIAGSKKRLEEEIEAPVDHFSYPHPALNPQWSQQTLNITREAGFKSAALTTCGPVHAGDEALALKRIYCPADLDQFIWNIECTFLGRAV
jgi:peptidoglycan/xylan/chitin deacetylase (PgdA/CDA1 family)